MPRRLTAVPWLCLALSACGSASRTIDDNALADEASAEDWLAYGRTYSEQRFSPLTQIDTANVANLKVDWFLEAKRTRRNGGRQRQRARSTTCCRRELQNPG
jgi:glucose dehydrogenase